MDKYFSSNKAISEQGALEISVGHALHEAVYVPEISGGQTDHLRANISHERRPQDPSNFGMVLCWAHRTPWREKSEVRPIVGRMEELLKQNSAEEFVRYFHSLPADIRTDAVLNLVQRCNFGTGDGRYRYPVFRYDTMARHEINTSTPKPILVYYNVNLTWPGRFFGSMWMNDVPLIGSAAVRPGEGGWSGGLYVATARRDWARTIDHPLIEEAMKHDYP